MMDCLQSEPELRPTSAELDTRLKRIDGEKMKLDSSVKRSLMKNPTMSLNDVFPAHIAKVGHLLQTSWSLLLVPSHSASLAVESNRH